MDVELIFLIILLSAIAMYQFFKGRKLNLGIMSRVSNDLEESLKPLDKEYTWLGGYVGFKAKYKLSNADVEATLTLLPRHALLYFPISLLVNKADRLYIVVKGRMEINELHIFGKWRMLSRNEKKELKGLKLEERGGFSFAGDADEAVKIIRMLDNKVLFHLYAKKDYLYIFMDPKGRIELNALLSALLH
ncbi:MAG: hypothetical protein EF806_03630 [Candidatus Methanoliparum thermophilum]|uniref:Uncharacterized protein n=1 Tax=Methanoliparum thermophilum TaxID=2491083 RepID=A0A520KRQ5_METT2|nr:hypothetical protein [Candidatus Methanoliparum sp. LAM-1]RZN64445.1 MAG: hypothetical protein EF806_03630 [Candidatus Methanoliparum thermophilum]BDC35966.1 hypothetical protein MTLP_06480 [Candidatus Methanoliparum sp. LAM-1]